ncbi:MAG: hypothetical protein Q9160_001379 [Pyrenula sp. 1 TL-2023]
MAMPFSARLCAAPRPFPFLRPFKQGFPLSRTYATQSSLGSSTASSRSSRKQITVTTDDGRYQWAELSTKEKVSRSTQQSFFFLLVIGGATATVTVFYFLYKESFASDSKTRQFNHAVDRVKADSRCQELIGRKKEIWAYGEPKTSRWARSGPLAATSEVDRYGTEHLRMHFHVEGPEGKGVVRLHMTKGTKDDYLTYRYLTVDVPGHPTIYLEGGNSEPKKAAAKLFGIQWTGK